MKKYLPYILGALGLLALLIITLTGSPRSRKMDEHLSFRYKDKVPYGYYAAYHLLPNLFPEASIIPDSKEPGRWDSLSENGSNQAVILVAPYLNADSYELNSLVPFVKNGNHVFIITKVLSFDARHFFHIDGDQLYSDDGLMQNDDSLTVQFEVPPFSDTTKYFYPGRRYSSMLSTVDSQHVTILGRNGSNYPDFIQYHLGEGTITLHLAPLAFSNYFLLRDQNHSYFANALSVLPSNLKRIVWNDYYLYKPYDDRNGEKEPNWLGVLLKYREFKWAIILAIITSLLFLLLGMRRNQRMIPARQPLPNDSLDFTKTLGRLYYEKGDHHDLARKMSIYFLDHVKTKYQLSSTDMDITFVKALHNKSGYPEEEISSIIQFIKFLQENNSISENQLLDFNNRLDLFYQNT